jgi:hypothetical protein
MLLDDNGKTVDRPVVEAEAKQEYYEYDESYFLTNPEELIYSHFPDDNRWQLLSRKVSADEFQQMAFLKMPFFEYGLRLVSHTMCMIDVPDGLASIKLGMEKNARNHFMYRLWISNAGGKQSRSDLYQNVKLTRFVFMENRDGLMKCDIKFPVAGKFKLEFFCNNGSSETYYEVCAYVLTAKKAADNKKPYPENNRQEWGPGKDLEEAGLRPQTHKEGLIEADGETELRFKADKDVEILAKLSSDKMTKEQLERYVLHRVEREEMVVNVRLPEEDDYVLNLYARRRNETGDDTNESLRNVCSYLISSSKPAADPTPFPKVANGRFGHIKRYQSSFEVEPISHSSAFITAPGNGDPLTLTMNVTPSDSTRLLIELLFFDGDTEKKLERYTFVDASEDGVVTVTVRFIQKGQYVLNIYGRNEETDVKSTSYSLAYRYLIRADQASVPCCQFPVTYDKWTKHCRLIEPDINCPITAGSTIPFRVKIPNAHKVAVKTSDRSPWTYLDKREGLWTGQVTAGNEGDKVQLLAGFDENSTTLGYLLEFTVSEV